MLPRSTNWFREDVRPQVMWLFLILTAVLTVLLGRFRPPGGYLALEMPILDWPNAVPVANWSTPQREDAFFGLGLDYLYLCIYPLALSLLCGSASSNWSLPKWLSTACGAISSLVLFACPADAAENVGVYLQLIGGGNQAVLLVTSLVSLLKWALIFTALFAALIGICVKIFHAAFERAD